MSRRIRSMFVTGIAAAALAASGAAPAAAASGAATFVPEQNGTNPGEAVAVLDAAEVRDHRGGTDPNDDDTPWHLLPEDEPTPVEHLACEPVSETLMAC